jgi:hypothetical protein
MTDTFTPDQIQAVKDAYEAGRITRGQYAGFTDLGALIDWLEKPKHQFSDGQVGASETWDDTRYGVYQPEFLRSEWRKLTHQEVGPAWVARAEADRDYSRLLGYFHEAIVRLRSNADIFKTDHFSYPPASATLIESFISMIPADLLENQDDCYRA